MNHKYIFLLILFHFSNTLIGMEKALGIKQWWYLDDQLRYGEKIKSACFNFNSTGLITTSYENSNAVVRNIKSKGITAEFPSSSQHKYHCFDLSQTLVATSLPNNKNVSDIIVAAQEGAYANSLCKLRREVVNTTLYKQPRYDKIMLQTETATIFDTQTGEVIVSFKHPNIVQDLCFDHTGKSLATACNQTARIFKRYEDYTLEQLQLKKAMNTWLLIKKPYIIIEEQYNDPTFNDFTFEDRVCTSGLALPLLKDIANKQIMTSRSGQCYTLEELIEIWKTFPSNMQDAILRTMVRKIKRHGHIDIIGNMNGLDCIIMKS